MVLIINATFILLISEIFMARIGISKTNKNLEYKEKSDSIVPINTDLSNKKVMSNPNDIRILFLSLLKFTVLICSKKLINNNPKIIVGIAGENGRITINNIHKKS